MKRIIVMLLGACIFVGACASGKDAVELGVFNVHENSWDEVFEHATEMEIHTWSTGVIEADPYGLLNRKHPNAPDFTEKRIFVDVPVTYAHVPNHGWLLFDTGLDKTVQTRPYAHYSGLLTRLIVGEMRQNQGQDVAAHCASLGAFPDFVFFTHMHFDHVMGLIDLPEQTVYCKGENEEPINVPFLFTMDQTATLRKCKEIAFSSDSSLYPFDQVVDVFGDSSVYAIYTAGHTKGHTSYLINSSDGPLLIAGDAVNIPQNLESGAGPGSYSWNVKLAEKHFNQIREFLKMYPEVKLQMGHFIEG